MIKIAFVIAAFVLLPLTVVAQTASNCPGNSGLTATEIDALLEAHNTVRAEASLAPLTWDCKVAESAQEWANQGLFQHRDETELGENLFVSSSAEDPKSAVKKWRKEKNWWDNQTATCLPGKMCTHYTQIVWKTTTTVGCGINRNAPGKWKVLVVCNYTPAGNLGGPPF